MQRNAVLQQFRELPAGALVATDVAARGLDIPDVHVVLHFDAPQDPANFVHRCGRTARMGRSGRALALLTPHEDVFVQLLRQRGVPVTDAAPNPTAEPPAAAIAVAARRLSETEREARLPLSSTPLLLCPCIAPCTLLPHLRSCAALCNASSALLHPPALLCALLPLTATFPCTCHPGSGGLQSCQRLPTAGSGPGPQWQAMHHRYGPSQTCMAVQVMEKGTKAFVAYVRGYKEHHCKYVFQLRDLCLAQLGSAFGLLRLPVMKEVRSFAGRLAMLDAGASAWPCLMLVPRAAARRLFLLLPL
jgi:hypothetical protein